MSRIDYTGMTIGRLTFLKVDEKKINNHLIWNVKCQCGHEQKIRSGYISNMKHRGDVFECSKCKLERKSPTLTNKVFGRLTVLKEVPGRDHHRWWLCRCECGVEKAIASTSLINKRHSTKSCGCLARKLNSKWVNTTQYPPSHGLKAQDVDDIKASLYFIRNAFVSACYRENDVRYKNYGKLGKTVCDLWRNGAEDFVKWALKQGYKKGDGIFLKPGKTIFNPNNCYIQRKGEFYKKNNSKFITFNGKTQSITDWSKELKCTISCLSQRLKKFSDYPIDKIMDIKWKPIKTQFYGTEQFEKDIIELYQEGKTYKEICELLGCCSSTVKRFLTKNHIQIRKSCRRSVMIA